jgi:glycosyltransferase involved in cell wall biosynthesis
VIGSHPPPDLQQIPSPERIQITGYVSQLETLLSETAVFIVPLHAGGGMRVKILDAWNWGLPVVSTAVGAEGLEYQDGENLMIADSSRAFSNAVLKLLTVQSLASRLSESGRSTVESKYNWNRIYKDWDRIYQ